MPSEPALSAFIQAAPPGELSNVTSAIKTLASASALAALDPAYQTYNETQLTTVKLPGSSESVLVSAHNRLPDGRYYDVDSATSFEFDQRTGKASAVQSHVLEGEHAALVKSISKALRQHTDEHFPSSTTGVFPTSDGSGIAILTVANKYSPNNFWNGRWRSTYTYTPSTTTLTGTTSVDVHYYEDGNVRLLTSSSPPSPSPSAPSPIPAEPTPIPIPSGTASDIVKAIAAAERRYQQDLHRGFAQLSEGAFKALRRQLPVTRQKMEWEKVSSYRVGQDIGGAGAGAGAGGRAR